MQKITILTIQKIEKAKNIVKEIDKIKNLNMI